MYAIIDLETTGSHRSSNRITEIALYIFDGEQIVDSFESLIDPECSIPPFIRNLTGIDDSMVQGKPKFYEVAEQVQRMTEGCVFVAHNVGFDYNVLRKEYASLGFNYVRKKLCTVRLARKAFPGYPKYSLGNICAALGIPIEARHRAAGDAKATVELFRQILVQDDGKWVPEALHHRSKEGCLPPALDAKEVEQLPNTPGVYYFKDSKGKVIYVGKSIKIRTRVMSHFYSRERKEVKMHADIAHVDFKLCGSELLSLLIESAEIKQLYPLYNAAQKRNKEAWCIFTYHDQQGVQHLAYAKKHQVKRPLLRFYTIGQCRSFLETLQESFDLCPRYMELQKSKGACFHHTLKQCKGVCAGKEEISDYNKRVAQAVESLRSFSGSFLILLPGRNEDEFAFVLIEQSMYQGYGFVPGKKESLNIESLSEYLIPQHDNADIQRILRTYFRHKDNLETIELLSPIVRSGQQVLSLF